MARDCREELLSRIKSIVGNHIEQIVALRIIESISLELADFEVLERETAVAVRSDHNEKILRRFIACLRIDGKSEKTIEQYVRAASKLLSQIGTPVEEVGTYDIRFFLAKEKERGVSNRTLENTRSYLSSFFQWMTKEDLIQKNPCANINPIKYPTEKRTPFSDTEIDALRSACRNKKERAIIEMLLSTGARISELVALDIEDINFTARSVKIRHGKGDKARTTYATPVAIKRLKEYLSERSDENTAAFANRQGERITPGGVRKILNTIGDRAKVENVHPHRFRRTMATGLAARGMDVQEVSKLLGHSNLNTTMVYVYTDDSAVQRSYSKYAV